MGASVVVMRKSAALLDVFFTQCFWGLGTLAFDQCPCCRISGILGYFREEEEVDQFFDSREEFSSLCSSCKEENASCLFSGDPLYEVWIKSPVSIQQRRSMFRRWMDGELMVDDSVTLEMDRLSLDSGHVGRDSDLKNGSPVSSCSDEVSSTSEDRSSDVQFDYRIKNLNDGQVFAKSEFSHDNTSISFQEVSSNQMVSINEFESSFGSSSLVPKLTRSDDSSLNHDNVKVPRRRRNGWLKRLGAVACIVDREGHEFHLDALKSNNQSKDARFERVLVRQCRKQSKEFSAMYRGQSFVAHCGAILAMKFSHNGEFLASGGEDGVVKVWKVMECQRTKRDDILADDPSCIYFDVSHNSELILMDADKKKRINSKVLCRASDSACIVFPPKIFQISDKPLHEFKGHHGDVLDLAWSKDKYLLSSSVDNTVRLWQLGFDGFLKVFPHSNYVTSIQFNPIDERYFISGSIDGKARIWDIWACRVVDWTYVSQIITAVCYRPDGKVVAIGSMTGDCRFYDASENHLQLEAEVSFQGRKKSLDKRITGFQFCPINHRQLIVTSADSVVRLLDGVDVVSKFKGIRNAGSRISAMFTLDGQHIVSASKDSNVYIWNRSRQYHTFSSNHVKSTKACERFPSSHVSIAVPWHGYQSKNEQLCGILDLFSTSVDHMELGGRNLRCSVNSLSCKTLSPSSSFTRCHEFFSEVPPKGSATWPEEKLPSGMSSSSNLRKSQLMFLKASFQKNTSHAWGQVIVTAGWDGRIRLFQNFGLPVRL